MYAFEIACIYTYVPIVRYPNIIVHWFDLCWCLYSRHASLRLVASHNWCPRRSRSRVLHTFRTDSRSTAHKIHETHTRTHVRLRNSGSSRSNTRKSLIYSMWRVYKNMNDWILCHWMNVLLYTFQSFHWCIFMNIVFCWQTHDPCGQSE